MNRRPSVPAAGACAALFAGGLLLAACTPKEEPPPANAAPTAVANANAGAHAAADAGHRGAVHAGPLAGADLAAARRLFKTNCQTCHLESGKGDPHHRKDGIPNFTDASWQAKQDDQELFGAIANGQGKTMPAFKGDLSDDEIRLLVHFVREFPARGATASDGGQRAPATGTEHGGHDAGAKRDAAAPANPAAKAPAKAPAKPAGTPPAPAKPADHGAHGGHPPRR